MRTSVLKWASFWPLLGICAVLLAGCEKTEDEQEQEAVDYNAGEIPGLGETDGELTGAPFQLPDGIELIEEITGAADQDDYWNINYASGASFTARSFINKSGVAETKASVPRTRVGEEVLIHYFGSGYGFVDLLIPMRNSRSTPVTVTFPAATVLLSESGESQNGVLIKKVTITIPPNDDYHLSLSFYCGNASKNSAHRSDVYVLGVVSNARPLLDLCDRVKNKKINIEEFSPTSRTDYDTYFDQVNRLQDIVWLVTDYGGMSEEDIEYINSLPNS
ncbi:MAG: hypothetical protein LBQ78_04510 [Tannerellaceae bacterium]|jgi:hypothetical protein|nr:hypothetical protein [Tannerellaceae bacterium]